MDKEEREKLKEEGINEVTETITRYEELITCPATDPPALRSLKACERCEQHIEIQQLAPAQNKRPPVRRVRCNLPRGVNVIHKLIEDEEES